MNTFPTPETWYAHRVSYGETDCMNVLYYGEYFHIFERSRSQFIRELGMSYTVVEERGLFLPVREAWSRYRTPARYDDLIWVRAGIKEWGKASLTFIYEVYNEEKTRIQAEGGTQHACVDKTGKPVRVPDWFRSLAE